MCVKVEDFVIIVFKRYPGTHYVIQGSCANYSNIEHLNVLPHTQIRICNQILRF